MSSRLLKVEVRVHLGRQVVAVHDGLVLGRVVVGAAARERGHCRLKVGLVEERDRYPVVFHRVDDAMQRRLVQSVGPQLIREKIQMSREVEQRRHA